MVEASPQPTVPLSVSILTSAQLRCISGLRIRWPVRTAWTLSILMLVLLRWRRAGPARRGRSTGRRAPRLGDGDVLVFAGRRHADVTTVTPGWARTNCSAAARKVTPWRRQTCSISARSSRGRASRRVVVPGTLDRPGQDTAVEHPRRGRRYRGPRTAGSPGPRTGRAGCSGLRPARGRVAPLEEGRRRLDRVRPQGHSVDHTSARNLTRALCAPETASSMWSSGSWMWTTSTRSTRRRSRLVSSDVRTASYEKSNQASRSPAGPVPSRRPTLVAITILWRPAEGRAEPALGLAQPVGGRRVDERHPGVDGSARP